MMSIIKNSPTNVLGVINPSIWDLRSRSSILGSINFGRTVVVKSDSDNVMSSSAPEDDSFKEDDDDEGGN